MKKSNSEYTKAITYANRIFDFQTAKLTKSRRAYRGTLQWFDKKKIGDITAEDARVIIYFLNQWKCRVPKKGTPKHLRELIENPSFLKPLKTLKKERLEDIELSSESTTIERLYDRAMEIEGIGATVTSKILHVLNPNLFVMWDDNIRDAYNYSKEGGDYREFMEKMQKVAKWAINGCKQDGENLKSAKQNFLKNVNEETLTRALDKFNMTIWNRLPKLLEGIEKNDTREEYSISKDKWKRNLKLLNEQIKQLKQLDIWGVLLPHLPSKLVKW